MNKPKNNPEDAWKDYMKGGWNYGEVPEKKLVFKAGWDACLENMLIENVINEKGCNEEESE